MGNLNAGEQMLEDAVNELGTSPMREGIGLKRQPGTRYEFKVGMRVKIIGPNTTEDRINSPRWVESMDKLVGLHATVVNGSALTIIRKHPGHDLHKLELAYTSEHEELFNKVAFLPQWLEGVTATDGYNAPDRDSAFAVDQEVWVIPTGVIRDDHIHFDPSWIAPGMNPWRGKMGVVIKSSPSGASGTPGTSPKCNVKLAVGWRTPSEDAPDTWTFIDAWLRKVEKLDHVPAEGTLVAVQATTFKSWRGWHGGKTAEALEKGCGRVLRVVAVPLSCKPGEEITPSMAMLGCTRLSDGFEYPLFALRKPPSWADESQEGQPRIGNYLGLEEEVEEEVEEDEEETAEEICPNCDLDEHFCTCCPVCFEPAGECACCDECGEAPDSCYCVVDEEEDEESTEVCTPSAEGAAASDGFRASMRSGVIAAMVEPQEFQVDDGVKLNTYVADQDQPLAREYPHYQKSKAGRRFTVTGVHVDDEHGRIYTLHDGTLVKGSWIHRDLAMKRSGPGLLAIITWLVRGCLNLPKS